jgi:hypothetical protein
MTARQAFDPIFVDIALAISGLPIPMRLLLAWAMRD